MEEDTIHTAKDLLKYIKRFDVSSVKVKEEILDDNVQAAPLIIQPNDGFGSESGESNSQGYLGYDTGTSQVLQGANSSGDYAHFPAPSNVTSEHLISGSMHAHYCGVSPNTSQLQLNASDRASDALVPRLDQELPASGLSPTNSRNSLYANTYCSKNPLLPTRTIPTVHSFGGGAYSQPIGYKDCPDIPFEQRQMQSFPDSIVQSSPHSNRISGVGFAYPMSNCHKPDLQRQTNCDATSLTATSQTLNAGLYSPNVSPSTSNSLPNIGIFFNQTQAKKSSPETPIHSPHHATSASLNGSRQGPSTSTTPSPLSNSVDSPVFTCGSPRPLNSHLSLESMNDSPIKPKSPNAARSPNNVYNISARKLPGPTEQSSTSSRSSYPFRIRFPSSSDLGPIYEPNQFSKSSQSQENSKRSGISWFSDRFFGRVLDKLGSDRNTDHPNRTGSHRLNSESRRNQGGKHDRRALKPLPHKYNRNASIRRKTCSKHYKTGAVQGCKPCSVVLKDIRHHRKSRKLKYQHNLNCRHDESKRLKRNASKWPCQLSCCRERNEERPALRVRIYRCKPCKVVLTNIWPWLQKLQQMEEQQEYEQDKYNQQSDDGDTEEESTDASEDHGENSGELGSSNDTENSVAPARAKLLLYICRHCSVSFSVADEYAQHLQSVHNKAYFKCSTCLQRFYSQVEYSFHINNECSESKSSTVANTSASVKSNAVSVSNTMDTSNSSPLQAATPDTCSLPALNVIDSCDQSKKDDGQLQTDQLDKHTTSSKSRPHNGEVKEDIKMCEENIADLDELSPHSRGNCSKHATDSENIDDDTDEGSKDRHMNDGDTFKCVENIKVDNTATTRQKTEKTTMGNSDCYYPKDVATKQDKNMNFQLSRVGDQAVTFNSAVDNLFSQPSDVNIKENNVPDAANEIKKEEVNNEETSTENKTRRKPQNGLSGTMVPMYICKKCKIRFDKVSDCSEHLRRVHNKASYFKCSSCEKRFLTEPEFLSHIESICLPKDSKTNLS